MNVNAMDTDGLAQSFSPASGPSMAAVTGRALDTTDKWLIGIAAGLAIVFYFDIKLLG